MLTKKRRNEIAYLLFVNRMRNEGIDNLRASDIRRETGNKAKELNISFEETHQFTKDVIIPLVEEAFSTPKNNLKSLKH